MELVRDVGPDFAFSCNFTYYPQNSPVYVLNRVDGENYYARQPLRAQRAGGLSLRGLHPLPRPWASPPPTSPWTAAGPARARLRRHWDRLPQVDDM